MSALFGGELPDEEYDGALFGGGITAESTVSKTDYIYAIIFDPKGYRRLIGEEVFRSRHDAEKMLSALVCDYPEEYNFDDYTVMALEVDE